MPYRPKTHRAAPALPPPPRPTPCQKGYGYKWQQRRKVFLGAHPLCAECERLGRLTPATVVDHVIPHKGDMVLFWQEENWQSLCARHHNMKSAKE